jgi:hypothetical protein
MTIKMARGRDYPRHLLIGIRAAVTAADPCYTAVRADPEHPPATCGGLAEKIWKVFDLDRRP